MIVALCAASCGGHQSASVQVPAPPLRGLRLSAGASHTCTVTGKGEVFCWGSNVDGQLGSGDTVDHSAPVRVVGLTNAAGVSAGSYHACALEGDATMQCWGWNSYGQVGAKATIAATHAARVPGLSGVTAIATGGYHSCALLSDQTGSCWGQDGEGQLGDGRQSDSATPTVVFSLPASKMVAAAGRHTCVVVHDGYNDGTVECWGANGSGELGDGTFDDRSFPTLVSGSNDVSAVTAGFSHSCALRTDGSVLCWGANDNGQLGDNGASGASSAVPVVVQGLTAVSIAAGYTHTCAIVSDASVVCWGSNEAGQLGDGSTDDQSTPVAVKGLSNVTDIAGGSFHTCAETSDGVIQCWGSNDSGQLGDGTNTSHPLPAPVSTIP